jgi:hypothetical protein
VPIIEPSAAAAERIEQRHARSRGIPHSHPCGSLPDDRATVPGHIRASCACRFPPNDRVGAVVIATSRGRGRDRSSSHGRRRQMSAPPLTEPPRETTALSPLADRSSSGRRAPLDRQQGGHFAARRHPRHEGANPRRPAIRGTRTCIWRTDRSGPSPRGSSDTCSRRRPSRRSFWAGGLPRRLRRCVDPPAGRAGGRR